MSHREVYRDYPLEVRQESGQYQYAFAAIEGGRVGVAGFHTEAAAVKAGRGAIDKYIEKQAAPKAKPRK
jgi:hypothetical protein